MTRAGEPGKEQGKLAPGVDVHYHRENVTGIRQEFLVHWSDSCRGKNSSPISDAPFCRARSVSSPVLERFFHFYSELALVWDVSLRYCWWCGHSNVNTGVGATSTDTAFMSAVCKTLPGKDIQDATFLNLSFIFTHFFYLFFSLSFFFFLILLSSFILIFLYCQLSYLLTHHLSSLLSFSPFLSDLFFFIYLSSLSTQICVSKTILSLKHRHKHYLIF